MTTIVSGEKRLLFRLPCESAELVGLEMLSISRTLNGYDCIKVVVVL